MSTNSLAIKVFETDSGLHRVVIPDEFTVTDNDNMRKRETVEISSDDERYESETQFSKREHDVEVLSNSDSNRVYHFITKERLTLIIPHTDPRFQLDHHYIAVYASERSTFLFEYTQYMPRLNLYVFSSVFFSVVILLSSLLLASWKSLHFFLEWREALLERQLRERRALRPLYTATLYFHDGKGSASSSTSGTSPPQDSKSGNAVMASVDRELRSKSVLLLDNTPTYITKRRTKSNTSGRNLAITEFKLQRRRKKRTVVEDFHPETLEVWPVTKQPTADERASVYSVFVQLPVGSKHTCRSLCVGCTLVSDDGNGGGSQGKVKILRGGYSNPTAQQQAEGDGIWLQEDEERALGDDESDDETSSQLSEADAGEIVLETQL